MNFPVHFSSQLREHLKALRKARGLTQAALGQLLGVGQARIAEIESNPGVVSVEQLMKLLSALRASMVLRDDDTAGAAHRLSDAANLPAVHASDGTTKPTPRRDAKTSVVGKRRVPASTCADRTELKLQPVLRSDSSVSSDALAHEKTAAASGRIGIRPKKGSW